MTVNWIIQGGQTGVDRGAWAACKVLHLMKCGGIMPYNMQDEDGMIPAGVRERMRACEQKGLDARTKENVLLANAVVLVAEDRLNPLRTPGTKLTHDFAVSKGKQLTVVGKGDGRFLADWIAHLPPSVLKQSSSRSGEFFLMVAGPRRSLWPDGESVTCDLLVEAFKL